MIKKVKKNLLKMLKKRKYNINLFETDENKMYIPKEIMVYFILSSQLKPNLLKQEFEKIKKIEISFKKLIIIVLKKPTNSLIKITKLHKKEFDLQLFWCEELMIDKINHRLVPKHILIDNQEEIEYIKKKVKINELLNLPYILRTDPIVKYYDAKPGNIFKINRTCKYTYYRYVY